MARTNTPVCITCGLSAGLPPALNRLPNGQVCPSCRDRVLDWLPPVLPSRTREVTLQAANRADVPVDPLDLQDEGR